MASIDTIRARTLALFASLVLLLAHGSTKPYSPRRALPPTNIFQTTPGQSLQIDITNTTHSVSPVQVTHIQCFLPHPERPLATIDGCRATLNKIKTFPLYRLEQDFLENIFPRKPSPPPLAIYDYQCIVEIKANDAHTTDKFSFEQVRLLALDILEHCSNHGGIGGISPIGRGIGWTVAVKGVKLVLSPGRGREPSIAPATGDISSAAAISA